MPDFTQQFPRHRSTTPRNNPQKTPTGLSLCIILQYADSLRVMKNLPISLNSFLVN